MRYEIGEEILRLIRQEDRYDATIDPMLTTLPSYTQLGMAALLPNQELGISEDEKAIAMVDGQSSQGTANRIKILQQGVRGEATALRAEDYLAMPRDEYRALFRDHDVVYIYHNRIDATGDKRDSEERVFDEVEQTLEELGRLIRKLSNANVTNMIVTADHGFIYQNRPIDDSDFSSAEPSGDQVLYRDRRFVIGKGLTEQPGLRKFQASEVGLQGDLEIQISKSINRMRLKGSGSRYVHGGASLQEVVIPVVHINKKRQSDLSYVDVEILKGANTVITSGQFSVAFYQANPVDEKVQPRTLRAGIYTQNDQLISDSHELVFVSVIG